MSKLKTVAIYLLIIGVIGISINTLFGYNTVNFIIRQRNADNGYWFYYYDFKGYIDNLTLSINETAQLTLDIPQRQWQWMTDIFNWEPLANDLALILDWIIFLINCLIYPMRIGSYLAKQVLAVVGVNVTNTPGTSGIKWLTDLISFLQQLQIPYIQ